VKKARRICQPKLQPKLFGRQADYASDVRNSPHDRCLTPPPQGETSSIVGRWTT